MSPMSQPLLIAGTVLFLLSLAAGFAVPVMVNPRMGVSAHVAGLQGGIILWVLGLMWQRVALPVGATRVAQMLAAGGLYAVFVSLLLAALWGTSRATTVAGAGHQASAAHEMVVTVLLAGGSFASLAAGGLVLWGLIAWKS